MLPPLLAGYALAALGVGLLVLLVLAAAVHLVFGLLVDEFGHADPTRRRRGRWSFDAGLAVSAAGFVVIVALTVLDDAATRTTGLGFEELLYAGVGATVVGALAMAAGVGLSLDETR